MSTQPARILTTIAQTMVMTKRYASVDEALWMMALNEVQRKVNKYRRRVRRFQRKYHNNFEEFTASLQERAPIAEEDDWLEWRAARGMLEDWELAYKELRSHALSRQSGLTQLV